MIFYSPMIQRRIFWKRESSPISSNIILIMKDNESIHTKMSMHQSVGQEFGLFTIDLMFGTRSVSADLHSASFNNNMMTVTNLITNQKMLTINVKLHIPISVFVQLFHVAAQYMIQIKSVKSENAMRYQSLVFCLGYLNPQSRIPKAKRGRLQSGLQKQVRQDKMMIARKSLLV